MTRPQKHQLISTYIEARIYGVVVYQPQAAVTVLNPLHAGAQPIPDAV